MPETSTRTLSLSTRRGVVWQFLSFPMILFIAIPILAIFFNLNPARFLGDIYKAQAIQAIRLSLITSLAAVGLTLLFGTPLALVLSRLHSRLGQVLDILVDLPTVLPPAVAGIALLMAFGRQGLLGPFLSSMGITLPFTSVAVVIAQMFVAAPLYIKSAAIGFSNVDPELKNSAALDGANHWQTFRFISLPLSAVSVLNGSALTWARAMGEFGATIIFAGNFSGRTQTMPLAIYLGFEMDMSVALTLSAILILFSLTILILVRWIFRHSLDINGAREVE
jgi:molybdate transport system permease protein